MPAAFKLLRLIAIAWVLWAALAWLFQRELLYPRRGLLQAPELVLSLGGERWWLDTPGGRVEAWYFPAGGDGRAPAAICAHGNGELIDHAAPLLADFRALGVGVVLVEYPGYGRSDGSPSQRAIEAAFLAARERLVARPEVDAERLIYFGRSLGSGAVCALAAAHPPAALVLHSPFTSVRSFAPGMLLPAVLVRDPFDNLSLASELTAPLLVLHGEADSIIPVAHGRALARAASDGRCVEYPGGHNDVPRSFWGELRAFLERARVVAPR